MSDADVLLGENCYDLQRDEMQVLQSVYPERISVASEGKVNSDERFCFSIHIPIKSSVEGGSVNIETWIPAEFGDSKRELSPNESDSVSSIEHAAKCLPPVARPTFNRSISGKRWHVVFSVTYLLPVNIHVTLPADYPDHSPPEYHIGCMWLSEDQLTHVCQQLDHIWQDNSNMPVIYNWINWIEHDMLIYLGLEDVITLNIPEVDVSHDDINTHDRRIIVEFVDLEQDLMHLLKYDLEQESAQFNRDTHTCGVCLSDYVGKEFIRLTECRHHICAQCMRHYANMHVLEGTVQLLKCAIPECESVLTPDILQLILSQDEFSRWERLILQRALDSMSDIEWCPRCQMPVIHDEGDGSHSDSVTRPGDGSHADSVTRPGDGSHPDSVTRPGDGSHPDRVTPGVGGQRMRSKMGHCVQCHYTFCTQCRDTWHQGMCVNTGEELEKLEKEQGEKKEEVSEKERQQLEVKRRILKQKLLNKLYLKSNTKPCPHCKAPIEKNMGCNRIVCWQCNKGMCWLCGRPANTYQHFSDRPGCHLFTQEVAPPVQRLEAPPRPQAVVRIEELVQENPERRHNLINCPGCKQRLLRETNNNHIKCWNCKSNVCFLCRTRIVGKVSAHFGGSAASGLCVQHS